MLGKLAAIEMHHETKKKLEFTWFKNVDSDKDPIFDFFCKLYDQLKDDTKQEVTVSLGGTNFKITKSDYSGFYDIDLKKIKEGRVCKDYSKQNSPKAISATSFRKPTPIKIK